MDQKTKYPDLLSAEQERTLICAAQQGDRQAMDDLIAANHRLIWKWVSHYISAHQDPQTAEDFYQEASLGFATAILKFDLAREGRLSTYAVFWIRQALSRRHAQSQSFVYVPTHIGERLQRLKQFQRMHEQQDQEEASEEQIASHLNLSRDEVRILLRFMQHPKRIHAPRVPGESKTQEWTLADLDNPIDTFVERLDCHDRLTQLLAVLPRRELQVILWRFFPQDRQYLNDIPYQEIARLLGVSRERVRQLEAQALTRMRKAAQQLQLEY